MDASYLQTNRLVYYIRATERREISNVEGAKRPVLHFMHLLSWNKLFFMRQIAIAKWCLLVFLPFVGCGREVTFDNPHPLHAAVERRLYIMYVSIHMRRSQPLNIFLGTAISHRAVQSRVACLVTHL